MIGYKKMSYIALIALARNGDNMAIIEMGGRQKEKEASQLRSEVFSSICYGRYSRGQRMRGINTLLNEECEECIEREAAKLLLQSANSRDTKVSIYDRVKMRITELFKIASYKVRNFAKSENSSYLD